MRNWRVGTVSMGLSLILLGVILPISQMKGSQAFEPLLLWWPAILVVLGIEILLFLFVSKQENPVIKYDFLSILFVGVLGTVGITLTVLTSTGLLEQVQTVVGSEEVTFDLPELTEALSDDIKRVIIETGNQPVTVEGTTDKALHVFGTYRTALHQDDEPPITSVEEYTLMKTVGNTLYIYMKDPKMKTGPFSSYTNVTPTIVVPENLRLEVRGQNNEIDLHASSIGNHWLVDGAGEVDVHVNENTDMKLSATVRQELVNSNKVWDQVEEIKDEVNQYTQEYKGLLTLGTGTYHLSITNSDWVELHIPENMK
ncbi:hypothetical protein [Litchfieldia salsa]|uniref:Uncharacterized protein n=1 Tax=Litchfieldia salsa TaxID=930152 RepID=A0A1H0X2S4_9BACI|nr:hypothetical protein [Litchfieldia salsa]SDP97267.1 hypothetical protein SAMN05216565_1278 [Litchfieldia salsa]